MPFASIVATSQWLSSQAEVENPSTDNNTFNNISSSFVGSSSNQSEMSDESDHDQDETMSTLSRFLNKDAAVLKRKGPGRPKKSDKEETKRVVVVTKKRAPSKRKLRQPDFYAPPLIWLTKEKSVGRTEKSDKEDKEFVND